MRPQPNLAGFRDAMGALRDRFGQEVTFLVPQAASYDPATTRDPESGNPYDPWAPPTAGGGQTQVTKHLSVVSRPLVRLHDEAVASPIGEIAGDKIAVILPYEEWPDVAGATHFLWLDDRYKITEVRDDAMATVYRRKLIFGTKS